MSKYNYSKNIVKNLQIKMFACVYRYVDAQRDVAVDMGERDIRREILKHR